jgi:hypothetical protein
MTRRSVLAVGALIVTQIAHAPVASAQTAATHEWSHGTILTALAGAATAPSADTRATLGGGFGWEINHRVSVEGSGAWLVPRHDDQGFAADLTALVHLTRPIKIAPFVGGGVGLYIASFDTTAGPLPDFYQKRLPQDSPVTQRTFTDPSFVFTGGVDILATPRWSIRPDVSVKLVTDGSSAYAITIAAVRIAYHFEFHDVVHSRR